MFCATCGVQLPESVNFCPACGMAVAAASSAALPQVTEVFRQQKAFYHPSPSASITGVLLVSNLSFEFRPHFFLKPILLPAGQIASIGDAHRVFSFACFEVYLRDGAQYAFSLGYLDLQRTQSVVNLIRTGLGFS